MTLPLPAYWWQVMHNSLLSPKNDMKPLYLFLSLLSHFLCIIHFLSSRSIIWISLASEFISKSFPIKWSSAFNDALEIVQVAFQDLNHLKFKTKISIDKRRFLYLLHKKRWFVYTWLIPGLSIDDSWIDKEAAKSTSLICLHS